MKKKRYSIRELKGRMANFADEGNTFEDKVEIINQNLFCGILRDKFRKMSPEQFIKFVRGGLYFPDAKGQYKAICRYLADVLSYVAGISDRKPNALRVYSASKELAKTHIDLEKMVREGLEDFFRRVFEAKYAEDPNEFVDFLNDEDEVENWIARETTEDGGRWGLIGEDFIEIGELKEYGQSLNLREAGVPDEKYLQGNVDLIKRLAFNEGGLRYFDSPSPYSVLNCIFAIEGSFCGRSIIEQLVEKYKTKPRKDNAPSIRTLCQAIDSQTDDGLREMLSLYKNINAKTPNGDTLLSYAIYRYNYEAVDLLIEMGADVNAKNKDGDTPLHSLAYTVTDDEFYTGDSLEPNEYIDMEWLPLIKNGADVNAENDWGDTPLMVLAKSSIDTAVTYLLNNLIKAGADVNKTDRRGETALTRAVSAVIEATNPTTTGCVPKDPEVAINNVKALLEAGADPNVLTDGGEETLLTNLFKSDNNCFTYYPIIVDALIKAGIDVNAKNFFNGAALPLAVNGASIYKNDEEKRTPLVDCVNKLLAAGADPDIEDDNGESARTAAEGDEELSDILLWSSYTDNEDE